jgi:hypothetical protein
LRREGRNRRRRSGLWRRHTSFNVTEEAFAGTLPYPASRCPPYLAAFDAKFAV